MGKQTQTQPSWRDRLKFKELEVAGHCGAEYSENGEIWKKSSKHYYWGLLESLTDYWAAYAESEITRCQERHHHWGKNLKSKAMKLTGEK